MCEVLAAMRSTQSTLVSVAGLTALSSLALAPPSPEKKGPPEDVTKVEKAVQEIQEQK